MKTLLLAAESITVLWFVVAASLSHALSFSFAESETSASDGITSAGYFGDENKQQVRDQSTYDIYWLQPAGFDSDVFSDEKKQILTYPENFSLTGDLDDQNWLIRNDLCPIIEPADILRTK